MRQQAQRRLRHHAEQPFAADEQAREIEALLVLVRAPAAAQHAAVGEDDLEAEHIVARHAVFQAARPAGVRGDIAADAAFLQRRGIGWIEEPDLAHLRLKVAGDHARLHHGDAVGKMDLLDAIHARHAQRDAAAHGHAAADVAHAGAARRHRDAVAIREAQGFFHVRARARQHHDVRIPRGKPAVSRMRGDRGLVGEDNPGSQNPSERGCGVHRAKVVTAVGEVPHDADEIDGKQETHDGLLITPAISRRKLRSGCARHRGGFDGFSSSPPKMRLSTFGLGVGVGRAARPAAGWERPAAGVRPAAAVRDEATDAGITELRNSAEGSFSKPSCARISPLSA